MPTRYNSHVSKAEVLERLLELPVEERLEILEVGWDSVDRSPAGSMVSGEVRQMLRERLAAYQADPSDTLSWEEVEEELSSPRPPASRRDQKARA